MMHPMRTFALDGATLNCLSRYLLMNDEAPVTTRESMAMANVIIMNGPENFHELDFLWKIGSNH